MVIKKIIDLTPKELEKLTGKHLSFKEKITFKFLKWKLKRYLKQRPEKLSDGKFDKLGRMSMIFGIGAFVLVFLPFATFLAIPAALLAIILGAVSIHYRYCFGVCIADIIINCNSSFCEHFFRTVVIINFVIQKICNAYASTNNGRDGC